MTLQELEPGVKSAQLRMKSVQLGVKSEPEAKSVHHFFVNSVHLGVKKCTPWSEKCTPWSEQCTPWSEQCELAGYEPTLSPLFT